MSIVDEISPRELGEQRIALTLSQATPNPRAFSSVLIDIDYDATLPEGIVLPLEFVVVGPTGAATYQRRLYRRFKPLGLAFVPREGGQHLVRLGEAHHNRWFGALIVDVDGDRISL